MDGSSTSGESKPYSCCAGFAYYSQALAQRGGKPFCLGLGYTKQGQLRPDESQAIPQGTAEYKFVCVGFTAHGIAPGGDQGTPLLPYCEGIELITYVEGQQVARTRLPASPGAIASPSDAPSSLLGQHQSPVPAALMSKAVAAAAADSDPSGTGVESVGSLDRAAASVSQRAAAHGAPTCGMQQDGGERAGQQQRHHVAQQQAAQQQQPQQPQQREQQQEDQPPIRPPFSERFQTRIARNIASMQSTLRNEGPLRLRSFASGEELQARLWEVGTNNCHRLNRAAGLAGTAIVERAGWAWQAIAARVAGGSAAGDSNGSGTAQGSARE